MKIIEVKNFSFRYANGDRDSLENVTLDVEEGTFNVLCGKSGCGKSTLLRQLKSDGPLWQQIWTDLLLWSESD